MAFALELFLDQTAAFHVRELWRALAVSGISSHMHDGGFRPHVTLAVCDDLDAAAAQAELALLAGRITPPAIALSSLGLFMAAEAVVFLGVTVTGELLRVHEDAHRSFQCYATGLWSYYLPDAWVPHCTLAIRLPRELAPSAVQVCAGLQLPLHATADTLALVELPSGRERFSSELGGR